MGPNRTVVTLAAVIVIIFAVGTLTTFGIGNLLDDGEAYPDYDISGNASDGSQVGGTATCRDTGESSSRPVLEFSYSMTLSDGTEFDLSSFLFLDIDGMPVDGLFSNAGTDVTLGSPVTLWRDSTGEYVYHIDRNGDVLAVDILADGFSARATMVQATP